MPVLVILGFLVYAVFIAVVAGGTLDVFWDWFIRVPNVWPDAPDLTIGSALGIMLVVGLLTQSATLVRGNDASFAVSAGRGLVYYGVLWVGALAYHFIFGIGS